MFRCLLHAEAGYWDAHEATSINALDRVPAHKDEVERHLYVRLTDLTNLDLRLICCDLMSTSFEGSSSAAERFGIGPLCVVADRALISTDTLSAIDAAGYDYVIATTADRVLRDSGSRPPLRGRGRPRALHVPLQRRRYGLCEILAGRYVLVTSLGTEGDHAAQILRRYRRLLKVEHRFRVLKDYLKAGGVCYGSRS